VLKVWPELNALTANLLTQTISSISSKAPMTPAMLQEHTADTHRRHTLQTHTAFHTQNLFCTSKFTAPYD